MTFQWGDKSPTWGADEVAAAGLGKQRSLAEGGTAGPWAARRGYKFAGREVARHPWSYVWTYYWCQLLSGRTGTPKLNNTSWNIQLHDLIILNCSIVILVYMQLAKVCSIKHTKRSLSVPRKFYEWSTFEMNQKGVLEKGKYTIYCSYY